MYTSLVKINFFFCGFFFFLIFRVAEICNLAIINVPCLPIAGRVRVNMKMYEG